MRIRTPILKRNDKRAQAVQELVAAHTGVKTVEVNTITGSVVIHYDPKRTTSTALFDLLKQEGCAGASDHTVAAGIISRGSALSPSVSKTVIDVVLENLLKHSATALVAALI
jgi:Zn-dependent membrane protease YugP